MTYIPNYIPNSDYLGEYISDLYPTLRNSLEFLRDEDANLENCENLREYLESKGCQKSYRGLPNKGYTVFSIEGNEVHLVYRHDFTFMYYKVEAHVLYEALRVKYGNTGYYGSLDSILARF